MNQSDHELQDVMDKLAALEPTAVDAPHRIRALAHMRQKVTAVETQRQPGRLQHFFTPSPARRMALTIASLIVVFAIALSFPAVRTAASEFLGLFRVQTFAAVSVSPEQMALLQKLAQEGLNPGKVTIVDEPGLEEIVPSLAEAGQLTNLTPRTLTALAPPADIRVLDGGSGYITIDLAGARAILAATGVDPALLPDTLDGARIEMSASAGIQQRWTDGLLLLQAASPTVEYPAEVANPTLLAEAFLRVLGLDAAEAQRLAQEIDWTSTLLLPLPANLVSFQEISVDGVSGLALQNLEGTVSALIWQKNGVLYLLQGNTSFTQLAVLAASLN